MYGPKANYYIEAQINEATARLTTQETNLAAIEAKPMEGSGRLSRGPQETDEGHEESFDLKRPRLVDKSLEAYVLALETINRLTIQYRLESFCYLFCNAWELLLKARMLAVEVDQEAIYYKPQIGKPKRTGLFMRDCLKQHFAKSERPDAAKHRAY